jgi:catechol 2,3-dioxygenase-like lactoylglutathione lyase family enzyme
MLADASLVAFVATTDAERSKAFYRDVLGLPLIADEAYALVFDAFGTSLRIQKVQAHKPLPYTALGFRVRAIARMVEALGRRGVAFESFAGMQQDLTGIWQAPGGAQVAWFKDPDGNLLSLTEG